MRKSKERNLRSVLKEERKAIISADFSEIDTLSNIKQALFENFDTGLTNVEELREIRDELVRNQLLLQASIKGVASARARLNALREVREELRVYDQSGRFSPVSTDSQGIVKRT